MKSVETVRVELQYSRAGTVVLSVMAAATLVVVLATPWATGLKAALAFAVAALFAEALQRILLLEGPHAIRGFRVQRDGRIEVESPSGALRTGWLAAGSFVAPWLVIVRWRPEGARRDATVLVLPDMAPAEERRRLRVLLRWA
jgi:hypothetical protein